MARRNLLRSLLAASVMVVSSTTGLLVAGPTRAGAADANLYTVTLSEDRGFNPGTVKVRVGDYIAFILDKDASSNVHSVTFDDQSLCPTEGGDVPCWPELRFNDENQKCMLRNYVLPNTRCIQVRTRPAPGQAHYHDQLAQAAGGPDFQGLIEVIGPSTPPPPPPPPPPPSTTSTTAAPTTTTTAPPAPTTTTTTLPPTTATTAPTTIRPFLIGAPSPTATTAAPAAGANGAGSGKNSGGATPTTAAKDKNDKGKDKDNGDAPSTSTTEAPDPETLVGDVTFADSLDLGPLILPDSVEPAETGDGAEFDAALDLLSSEEEEPADDRGWLVLPAAAAAGLFVLGAGFVAWFRRSSRYFPA